MTTTIEQLPEAQSAASLVTACKSSDDVKALIDQIPDKQALFQIGTNMVEHTGHLAIAALGDLDVTTEKGRKTINAISRKIGGTRTAFDNRAKAVIAELEADIKPLRATKAEVLKQFDALKESFLKDLNDWEAKEANKKREAMELIEQIRTAGDLFKPDGTEYSLEECKEKRDQIEAMEITPEVYGDFLADAMEAHKIAQRSIATGIKAQENLAEANRLAEENAKLRAAQDAQAHVAEDDSVKSADQLLSEAGVSSECVAPEVKQETVALVSDQPTAVPTEDTKKAMRAEAYKALAKLGFDLDLSKNFIGAIHKGMVPHVSMNY